MDELDGEIDCPLPNKAVITMKYLAGFRALSDPINHSLSEIEPEYQVGYRMAGKDWSPKVL